MFDTCPGCGAKAVLPHEADEKRWVKFKCWECTEVFDRSEIPEREENDKKGEDAGN